jgi:hypothetical protein
MRRRGNSRKLLGVAGLAVAALVFGGCDWTMFGYDAALTHSSPDTAINSANVSTLQPLFTTPGQFTSPVESNGVVYVGNTSGNLEAFDANGVTDCSGTPNQCTPLWTGTTPAGAINADATPAVANGVVYVSTQATSTSSGGLYVFDANGVTNCSGTPKVCQPLWTAPSAGDGSSASPIVANGVVYVGAQAFDANGVTNCSGTPKVCQALWTSSVPGIYEAPAVANGVLYATAQDSDTLYAFSAGGTTDCSGTPTTCAPLWTASMGTAAVMSSPAVSGGVVYAESSDGLFAFDAGGVTNCSGTPTTCSPLWTASLATQSQVMASPAVANGIVYAGTSTLEAFDANGVTNCSGSPKTCTPLWSYSEGNPYASPSVADGLVFLGDAGASSSTGSEFWAFDANGKTDCSGTPTVCSPLWTGATTGVVTGSPAIANGKVYVTDNSFTFFATHLYAWVLPPPTTSVILPSNNAAVSGTQGLDASASAGVTQLQYELTGGTLNHSVIATANLTDYGWTAAWDTTTVPNGVYTLQSVASYGGEVSGTSPGITVTVANPPTITVIEPSNNAAVSGTQGLDASASAGVTEVQYELSGGPSNLDDSVIATLTSPTEYGWTAAWDTATVPDGTYTLEAVAYSGGLSGTSPGITVTVNN